MSELKLFFVYGFDFYWWYSCDSKIGDVDFYFEKRIIR